jgi:uncharacterized membrane protein YdcZ (DUF606 family)
VAAAVGAAIAFQVFLVSRASERFDVLVVSMVLQAAGLIAGIAWTVSRRGWPEVVEIARIWWWVPAGVAGWIIVGALGFSSARIGVALTLAISIGTQLTIGLLIDAATGRSVTAVSAAGVVLVSAGVVLVAMRP